MWGSEISLECVGLERMKKQKTIPESTDGGDRVAAVENEELGQMWDVQNGWLDVAERS